MMHSSMVKICKRHIIRAVWRKKPTLLLGILLLVWNRSYYSDQDGIGWLGEGWSVPG